jgi:hypothetical protein
LGREDPRPHGNSDAEYECANDYSERPTRLRGCDGLVSGEQSQAAFSVL